MLQILRTTLYKVEDKFGRIEKATVKFSYWFLYNIIDKKIDEWHLFDQNIKLYGNIKRKVKRNFEMIYDEDVFSFFICILFMRDDNFCEIGLHMKQV